MTSDYVPSLPDEIYAIICDLLGRDRDFDTLLKCARSCKSIADAALVVLYKYHEMSPAFLQREEVDSLQRNVSFDQKWRQAEQSFKHWTLIWRSIIISSLPGSKTWKSYCRYIRILDFRNLAQMLDDPKFQNTVKRDFFKGPLQQFHFPVREGKRQVLDLIATTNAIGEAIIPQTIVLEEISGNLSPGFLARWITMSPKLKSIVLFSGEALASGSGKAIASHCANFQSLTIREWRGEDADKNLGDCLTDMPKESLEYFEIISNNDIHELSFKALSNHSNIRELKLSNMSLDAVKSLNYLKGCTELQTLLLHDNFGYVRLETMLNDVFEEVVQWLTSCKKLRDLTIKRFFDGPAILARVCSAPEIQLERLSVEGYTVRNENSAAFHVSLSAQRALQSLSLKGNGEGATEDDLNVMVDAIVHLDNLRQLRLEDVSDGFLEEHIKKLAFCLPELEDFETGGGEVGDELLEHLANMRKLKSLTLFAMTQFTSEALVNYFSSLDPIQQEFFSLVLMVGDPNYPLSEEEQTFLHTFIKETLNGRFEYVLWREESSDSDDE